MTRPLCVLVGAGRIAGGFAAPLLRAAGWEVVLACRSPEVCRAVNERGGLLLRTVGATPGERWVDGVRAVRLDDGVLPRLVASAELLATSVGPSALAAVGRLLGPLLGERFAGSAAPLNIITFENHRRAQELLLGGLVEAEPALAGGVGTRLGISGAAVWRTVSRREIRDGVLTLDADGVDECFVDAFSLLAGVAPLDGSLPGLTPVTAFDDRMVEKLWVFNAGHAAAAYLGWLGGHATVDAALADPRIRATTEAVVREAQAGFEVYLAARPGSRALPRRPADAIVAHYADPALRDTVTRVGREPRRKLVAGDRLIGPAAACLDAGIRPAALAEAASAALAYREPSDRQALDLQRELQLLGPHEVLSAVSTLDPRDELIELIADHYRAYTPAEAPA